VNLPDHRQDLLDLRDQIEAKLEALTGPIQLAVTGEWIITNGRKCVIPDGATAENTRGEWRNHFGYSTHINSFDTTDWHHQGIQAIRLTKKLPDPIQQVVIFEPYDVHHHYQFNPEQWVEVKNKNGVYTVGRVRSLNWDLVTHFRRLLQVVY
jgi:hypothetical protein